MVHDKCYQKAKEKYDVFPSAYASGYIAKCRKKSGKVVKSKKGTNLKKSIKKVNSARGKGGKGGEGGEVPKKKNGEPKLYKPFKSKKKGKKYSVYVKSESGGVKLIHFGDSSMEHYYDKIGLYSHLNHNDKERRKRYRQRHANDRINDKNTPGWWSWYKLW